MLEYSSLLAVFVKTMYRNMNKISWQCVLSFYERMCLNIIAMLNFIKWSC